MRYYLIILVGIIATSFAAIFIRLADEAPALIIAVYRLVLASLIMTPYALKRVRSQRKAYTAATLRWNIISGICLALHFATWIASLKYTSVARSVILVSLNPIFVAVLGWMFLRERLTPSIIAGILLSIAGIIIMSAGEQLPMAAGPVGDVLAIAGGFFAAIYFLIGRHLRQTISATVYSYVTYGLAAVVLVIITLAAGLPWTGYSLTTYVMFLLLALVPQIIGHTSFNYALRYVPAVIVAIAILGEPIGASALARILLNEPIFAQTVYGGVFVLLGIFLTVYKQEHGT